MLKVKLKESVTDLTLPKLNELRFSLQGEIDNKSSLSFDAPQNVDVEILNGNAQLYYDEDYTHLAGSILTTSTRRSVVYVKFSGSCLLRIFDRDNLTSIGTGLMSPFYKGKQKSFIIDSSQFTYFRNLERFILSGALGFGGDIKDLSGSSLEALNVSSTNLGGDLCSLLPMSSATLSIVDLRYSQVEFDFVDMYRFKRITTLYTSGNSVGDLGDLSSSIKQVFIEQLSRRITYSGKALKCVNLDVLEIQYNKLSTNELDNLIINLASLPWVGPYKRVRLRGVISENSDVLDALKTLESKGVSLQVKE